MIRHLLHSSKLVVAAQEVAWESTGVLSGPWVHLLVEEIKDSDMIRVIADQQFIHVTG